MTAEHAEHPGQLALDDALEQVERAVDRAWLHAARQAVATVVQTGRPFTTSDVWALLDGTPREPRVLGPIVRAWAKAGLIRPTGVWVMSDRPEAHRRPERQWRATS